MNCVQINYNITIFNCYRLIVVAVSVLQLLRTLFKNKKEQLAGKHLVEHRLNLKYFSKNSLFNHNHAIFLFFLLKNDFVIYWFFQVIKEGAKA